MSASYTDGVTFGASAGSTSFQVSDVVPPVIHGLVDIVVEANGPGGSVVSFAPTATDDVDGNVAVVCAPASGSLFPLGTTTVTCGAHDAANNASSGSFTVTVRDTTPPAAPVLTATPGVLDQPNHRMVGVVVGARSADLVSSPICSITAIVSNEPDNGLGDGDTPQDMVQTGPLTASLRAERSGRGAGRVYTLTVACKDAAGNTSPPASVAVIVPHNR
jgi:hypothetical protein